MSIIASDKGLSRYQDELAGLPPSGGGGCHVALLRIANYGRMADLSPEQIAEDLAAHVHGTRRVPAREIEAAVRKAFRTDVTSIIKPPLPVVDGPAALDKILKRGEFADEALLWELSPIRIDWPHEQDAIELLRRLYLPEDRLFTGSDRDSGPQHVLSAAEWIKTFEAGRVIPKHIIPNPLTGELGVTKDGKPSYRADSCVAQFKFAVVEFDNLSIEKQIQFWAGVLMPVMALVYSGGKSIHSWVPIHAKDAAEWEERVEYKLFGILDCLGADKSCKNEARLSRMPGHFRQEKDDWQRILYLNPAGDRPVMP